MLINHELRNIIGYCLRIFVCLVSIFIHDVSLVSCAADVFSYAAAFPDGRKDLARYFARWAGLTA